MSDVKPCPFCGGNAVEFFADCENDCLIVQCFHCSGGIPLYVDQVEGYDSYEELDEQEAVLDQLVARWNQRA